MALAKQERGVIGSDRDGVIFAQLRRNKKNEDWRPKTKDPNDESADENEDKKKIESELETKADTFENHHTKRDRPSNKSERNERRTYRMGTNNLKPKNETETTITTAPSIATSNDEDEEEEDKKACVLEAEGTQPSKIERSGRERREREQRAYEWQWGKRKARQWKAEAW